MNRTLASRLLGVAAPALATALLVAACAGDETSSGSATGSATTAVAWAGPAFVHPLPKPEFTLTTDEGRPYDFQRETQGKVALLYFGYTNCPDACPAAMANIALAVKRLPAAARAKVVTVFVTTDPTRDTPDKLKAWLAQFDPGIVGLTGSPQAIAQAQGQAQLPVASFEPDPSASPGGYAVDHAAVILAFNTQGVAPVAWPDGITVTGIAQDLGRLTS
ncbi:MAG TPA: SCO family protein [Candidatus Dormibacteraeota bacterium]|nr:SCO family protein [Candidatus Dormibacteraeota bacterium]